MIHKKEHAVVVATFDELAILEKYGTEDELCILNEVSASHVDQYGVSIYFARPYRAGDLFDAYNRALGRLEAEEKEEEGGM